MSTYFMHTFSYILLEWLTFIREADSQADTYNTGLGILYEILNFYVLFRYLCIYILAVLLSYSNL